MWCVCVDVDIFSTSSCVRTNDNDNNHCDNNDVVMLFTLIYGRLYIETSFPSLIPLSLFQPHVMLMEINSNNVTEYIYTFMCVLTYVIFICFLYACVHISDIELCTQNILIIRFVIQHQQAIYLFILCTSSQRSTYYITYIVILLRIHIYVLVVCFYYVIIYVLVCMHMHVIYIVHRINQ